MGNTPARPLILALGALLIIVAAVAGYRSFNARREAAQQAAVSKDLDRLAAPAPRRAPVSMRPGGR
jgi:hypothetical protein